MKVRQRAKKVSSQSDSEKLGEIIRLLQCSLAIQLYAGGVSQQQIAKNLGIAKLSVNQILKGFNKEGEQ